MTETIIYLRTSTEDQNPMNQLKDCLSINHYGDHFVLEDKQSAFKDQERPSFENLKKLIREGKIKHLLVWDFDRLFRSRVKFKEFLVFIKAYGVQLHSYRQQWLEELYKIPSPWNEIVSDLMINIYGHIAEDESRKKSERVRIAVRKQDGTTVSYRGNKWGRPELPDSAVQHIKQLHEQGISIRKIAKQVTYWDKNKNKRPVSVGVVHKIIHQPIAEQDTVKGGVQEANK